MPTTTETLVKTKINVRTKRMNADHLTPVMLYLAVRDEFTDPVLLESNEARDNEHYYSIVGLETLASFVVNERTIITRKQGQWAHEEAVENTDTVSHRLHDFLGGFELDYADTDPIVKQFNGLIGHTNFEGVQYFDTLKFDNK
ncbi:MAG: anthranilate synthase component 1, partial [Neolewinella sp.]